MLEIKIASPIGLCYGVKRAIKLAENTLKYSRTVYTFGNLAHNSSVIEYLEKKGIKSIDSVKNITPSNIVIRAHGLSQNKINELKQMNWNVIDGTCPNVKQAQKNAISLYKNGYEIILIGDKNHPEIKAIAENIDYKAHVILNPDELPNLTKKKVGILIQTTQTLSLLYAVTNKVLSKCLELKIYNTVCPETIQRQKSTLNIAKSVELMLVIGSPKSANTSKLFSLCENIGVKTYFIQDISELNKKWFDNISKVGITAGASTPDWVINEIINELRKY